MGAIIGRAGIGAVRIAEGLHDAVLNTEESGFGAGNDGMYLDARMRRAQQVQSSSAGKDDAKASSRGSSARADKEHIAELETEIGKLKQQLREARRGARQVEEAAGRARGL